MGTVLYLSSGSPRRSRSRPTKAKDSKKVALVLGGGGITGAAYHLGVLNAMNAMSAHASVNDFDIYVGTSAGAVVASCLANGITPEEMILANLGHKTTVPPIGADEVMQPDRRGLVRSMVRWPFGVLGALRRYAGHPFTTSLIDGLGALAEGLPAALYTTDGTERYVRELLDAPGRSNRFEDIKRKLLITATDIDSARRVVFGSNEGPEASISEAASASTAIPLLYAPRRIGNRVYYDGGLRSSTNIDVAIGHGAKLIICVNPLVPYVHDVRHLLPTATGLDARHISEKGFPHIAAQTFRIMAQAQVEKELELITHAHPDVDIILIEPRSDDEHMFIFNLMDYGSRARVARHAFETVAIDLVTRYPDYKKVLGRHGIKISRDLLIDQLQSVVEGAEPRFLEATRQQEQDVADKTIG
ncbi:MAG TPA: patatin-like phospholipase family protein [Actinomycetota bacterium]|nr:patatin-like phospholipase family protein [Actinomycetota bacterium]